MGRSRTSKPLAAAMGMFAAVAMTFLACQPYGRTTIKPAASPPGAAAAAPNVTSAPALHPIPRYGGTVLTAEGMPADRSAAYLWAKHLGTLVSYETFLRRYPSGEDSQELCRLIREKFVPAEKEWQEAWQTYSRMEIIDGAVCDPQEGLILVGRAGRGVLPPFLYEDLVAALKTILAREKVGVTMNRVFKARFLQPDDPREFPYEEYETSVDFYSRHLVNTHLAGILFEGDRALKTLSAGYDIFLGEQIRCSVPGFISLVAMEAAQPPPKGSGTSKYGRVWIELTSVRVNTTEARNAAIFSEVKMEVRAESKHAPLIRFAKHIQDHYDKYAAEFVIFGEVERAARVVAIAQWLVETYPEVASRIASDSYEPVRINTPQVIRARYSVTHKSQNAQAGLIGGVYLPWVNKYDLAPGTKVSDTELANVPQAIKDARPDPQTLAWTVPLGKRPEDHYIAWNVVPPKKSGVAMTGEAAADTHACIITPSFRSPRSP